jgi:hypothetical protein
VHPSLAAYRLLAGKIAEKVEATLTEQFENERQSVSASSKRKPDPRNAWVAGSQPVAKRTEPSRGGQGRGGHRSRWIRGIRGGPRWRGGVARRSGRGRFRRGFESIMCSMICVPCIMRSILPLPLNRKLNLIFQIVKTLYRYSIAILIQFTVLRYFQSPKIL